VAGGDSSFSMEPFRVSVVRLNAVLSKGSASDLSPIVDATVSLRVNRESSFGEGLGSTGEGAGSMGGLFASSSSHLLMLVCVCGSGMDFPAFGFRCERAFRLEGDRFRFPGLGADLHFLAEDSTAGKSMTVCTFPAPSTALASLSPRLLLPGWLRAFPLRPGLGWDAAFLFLRLRARFLGCDAGLRWRFTARRFADAARFADRALRAGLLPGVFVEDTFLGDFGWAFFDPAVLSCASALLPSPLDCLAFRAPTFPLPALGRLRALTERVGLRRVAWAAVRFTALLFVTELLAVRRPALCFFVFFTLVRRVGGVRYELALRLARLAFLRAACAAFSAAFWAL